MNRDDIIRMAREAGLHSAVLLHIYEGKEAALTDSEQDELRRLERFAALVAGAERDKWEAKFKQLEALMQVREQQPNKPCCLAEREACAQVCDDLQLPSGEFLENPAAAIRARGQG